MGGIGIACFLSIVLEFLCLSRLAGELASAPSAGAQVTCTSRAFWDGRNGASMSPGAYCSGCHTKFTIAGTMYPTLHEPSGCNGTNGTKGIEVVITGADGATLVLHPGPTGNFYSSNVVRLPFRAAVKRGAVTRTMSKPQYRGDCNGCHTPYGAFKAPGRVLEP